MNRLPDCRLPDCHLPDCHLPDWEGLRVVAAGGGVTGTSVVRALEPLGATVTVLDDRPGSAAALPAGVDLVVTSPGWRPDHPLLLGAAAAGVPVWGDVELAWRFALEGSVPWLVVTGTNGKTTTTELLAAVLTAAGRDALACGNIGLPLLDAVLRVPVPEVLAVELSSFQLHWAPSVRPFAGAVLNLAPDHLDWHGGMAAYAAAKLRAYGDADTLAVGVAGSDALLARAPGRRVLVTLDPPAAGQLGLVRQMGGPALLVDRCFGPGAPDEAVALASLDELPWVRAPHDLTNALAAAALARAYGVEAEAVAEGLGGFVPGAHRMSLVATVGGVRYVDDSKATNPHAAVASLTAHDDVVWLAGGLNKGLGFDELAIAAGAADVRAAVLLGACADEIAGALARHAPAIPVIRVADLDAGVREATRLAAGHGTVLLAPAAASMDMFRDYRERGEVFAAAVRRLEGGPA